MTTNDTTSIPGWMNPALVDSELVNRIRWTTAQVHALAESFYELAVTDIRPVYEAWRMFCAAQDAPEPVLDAMDEACGYQALSRLLTNLHQFIQYVDERVDARPVLAGFRQVLDGGEERSMLQVVERLPVGETTEEGSFYGD